MIKTYGARKLGVLPAHRKMMLRQLATSLVHFERITTTQARAKELRIYFERTLSKLKKVESTVNRARLADQLLAPNGYHAVKKLLETLLPRYQSKRGGFVRVIGMNPRRSDSAQIARVELLS